jgi:predicted small integral membrane protein
VNPSQSLLWIKALVAGGYALYLTLFVLNNVTDPVTNSGAIEPMMTMRGLKEDPPLGQGVVWRAIDSPSMHKAAYRMVIVVQAVAAVLLWRGTVMLVQAGVGGYGASDVRSAVGAVNLGMLVLVALALAFVLTGLWFVNWVKMGGVEQAHTTLLFIALFGVIVINLGVA